MKAGLKVLLMYVISVHTMEDCTMQNYLRLPCYTKNMQQKVSAIIEFLVFCYVDNIEILFDKYEKVDIKTMGFPENWKELLNEE